VPDLSAPDCVAAIIHYSVSPLSYQTEFLYDSYGFFWDIDNLTYQTNNYVERQPNSTTAIYKLKDIGGGGNDLIWPYDLSPYAGMGGIDGEAKYGPSFSPAQSGRGSRFANPLLLGDFTLVIVGGLAMFGSVVKYIFGNEPDQVNWQYRIYDTRLRFVIDGTAYNMYWYSDLRAVETGAGLGSYFFKMVVRRSGGTFDLSLDGGETWNSTTSIPTDLFPITHFLGQSDTQSMGYQKIERCMLAPQALTQEQIDEFIYLRYDKAVTLSPRYSSSTLTIPNLTWTDYVGLGYINIADMDQFSGHARTKFKNLVVGDKVFRLMHMNINDDFHDFIVTVDLTNEKYNISEDIVPAPGTDYHEHGSLFLMDNKLYHLYAKYYGGWGSSIFYNSTPNTYDVSDLTQSYVWKDMTNPRIGNHNYFGINVIGNKIVWVTQEVTYKALHMFVSDNAMQSWIGTKFVEDQTAGYWHYPVKVMIHTGTWFGIGIACVTPTQQHNEFCFVWTQDGFTLHNIDSSFTYDYRLNGPMTRAQMTTNFLVRGQDLGVGGCRCQDMHQDENGEFYGLVEDSNGSLEFFYGSKGGSWTLKTIAKGGKTWITYDDNGHDGAGVIKTGTNAYSLYVLEDNGGNYRVIKYTTIDKGTTWVYQSIETTDNAVIHTNLGVTENYDEFGKGVVSCTVFDGSNSIKLWNKAI